MHPRSKHCTMIDEKEGILSGDILVPGQRVSCDQYMLIVLGHQEADENLWPFAVDYAIFIWNNFSTNSTKLCPLELFSGALFPNHNHLQRTHIFGCPVFILDPKLQDAKKIPKWKTWYLYWNQ